MVVFLNAFVDLGHKIVIQNAIFKSYDGQEQVVLTAIVNGLILLPFILLFSPAGFLADKFAKHRIIRHSALFAVVATLLITFSYYQGWFWVAFALTFALAVQSAIYSPAKYGYIKELVGSSKLAAANGVVQAITIAGILLGTFVFSILFEPCCPKRDNLAPVRSCVTWRLSAGSWLGWLCWNGFQRRFCLPGSTVANQVFGMGPTCDFTTCAAISAWSAKTHYLAVDNWSGNFLGYFPGHAGGVPRICQRSPGYHQYGGYPGHSGLFRHRYRAGVTDGGQGFAQLYRDRTDSGRGGGYCTGHCGVAGAGQRLQHGLGFLLVGMMGGMFIVPLNALIQFQAKKSTGYGTGR